MNLFKELVRHEVVDIFSSVHLLWRLVIDKHGRMKDSTLIKKDRYYTHDFLIRGERRLTPVHWFTIGHSTFRLTTSHPGKPLEKYSPGVNLVREWREEQKGNGPIVSGLRSFGTDVGPRFRSETNRDTTSTNSRYVYVSPREQLTWTQQRGLYSLFNSLPIQTRVGRLWKTSFSSYWIPEKVLEGYEGSLLPQ